LLVASAEIKSSSTVDFMLKDGTLATLTVKYGDYSESLKRVVEALNEASPSSSPVSRSLK
jgi:hypothetical protein